jgi:hypothetical protein
MRLLPIPVLCLLLTSCATPPPGPEVYDSAERAIAAAERAGAEELAPVELQFAKERLALARTGMENGKVEPALYAIEQSEINAELASELSRTAQLRRDVNEARRANDSLRQELEAAYGEAFQ